MSTNSGGKYRKVSVDAALCESVESYIRDRPEVAKNLARFIDDATRRRLEDLYKNIPTSDY